MKLALIGAVLLMLIGCNAFTQSPEFPSGYCTEDNKTIFKEWSSLTKLNEEPLESEAHGRWVDIYVNDLAKVTYETASAPYEECAIVIKPLYDSSPEREVEKLSIMVKMSADYDPENGNWWYGTYDVLGVTAENGGKLEGCIDCHSQVANTDYMFSEAVMAAIRESIRE